jgi:hypothetical protein
MGCVEHVSIGGTCARTGELGQMLFSGARDIHRVSELEFWRYMSRARLSV